MTKNQNKKKDTVTQKAKLNTNNHTNKYSNMIKNQNKKKDTATQKAKLSTCL